MILKINRGFVLQKKILAFRPHRLVPDRPGQFCVHPAAQHPRDRRCGDCRGDAEIGFRRQRAGQGLRRRGGSAAGRRHTNTAQADQHLLFAVST